MNVYYSNNNNNCELIALTSVHILLYYTITCMPQNHLLMCCWKMKAEKWESKARHFWFVYTHFERNRNVKGTLPKLFSCFCFFDSAFIYSRFYFIIFFFSLAKCLCAMQVCIKCVCNRRARSHALLFRCTGFIWQHLFYSLCCSTFLFHLKRYSFK